MTASHVKTVHRNSTLSREELNEFVVTFSLTTHEVIYD